MPAAPRPGPAQSERSSEELGVNRIAADTAFTALKLVGGAYLIVLGALTLRRRSAVQADTAGVVSRPFRRGLLTNRPNPKVGVFYPTLLRSSSCLANSILAQSVPSHSSTRRSLSSGCRPMPASSSPWATCCGVRGCPRVLDRFTGVVLIALGDRIALERR